jgi:hypothetical protein
MNKLFAIPLIAAAFGFAAGSANAADQIAQTYTAPPKGTNTYPTMTPEEMERQKAEKAAHKETKSNMTAEQKKAAKAEKQKAMNAQGGDSTQHTMTAEEQAKAKAERAAKKQAKANMTAEQKKAAQAEKQRQLKESTATEQKQNKP